MINKNNVIGKALSVVGIFIGLFVIVCLISKNYHTKYGFFIDKDSAIKIYDDWQKEELNKYAKEAYQHYEEINLSIYKPYNVKFVLGVWILKRTQPERVRGGGMDMYLLSIGGVVLWGISQSKDFKGIARYSEIRK